MRQLELSHEDIDLIETALKYISRQGFETVRKDKDILGEKAAEAILENSNKFEDLRDSISNGEKDI